MTTPMTQQDRPTQGERGHERPASRPWYKRARYLVPVVAVAVIVAAAVAISAQDPTTTSPERDSGSAATPANRYDAAFGTFPPVTVSGTGSDSVDLPASLADQARRGIITIQYSAAGRFDVTLENGPALVKVDEGGLMGGGGSIALRGPYNGSFLFGSNFSPLEPSGAQAANEPWTLSVWGQPDSKASWQVTFAPISSAKELQAVASGRGDEVFVYDGELARLHFQQRPPGNSFNLAQWDLESVQGEIPRMSRAYVFAGPAVVAVSSSGRWSATLD